MVERFDRVAGRAALACLLLMSLAGCAGLQPGSTVQAQQVAVESSDARGTAAGDSPGPPGSSAAGQSLLDQSRAQQAAGDYAQAAASVERALRIDSRDPMLWLELGRIRLAEGDHVQAESLGHKTLSLAGRSRSAQTAAWELIAAALRGQGRNQEAAKADAQARFAAQQR